MPRASTKGPRMRMNRRPCELFEYVPLSLCGTTEALVAITTSIRHLILYCTAQHCTALSLLLSVS